MWVWVNSGSWWWIRRPGVLRFMGSQRVGHDWATELKWTEYLIESSLDCKEIQPVHLKGDQSWVVTGRTDYWNSNTLTTWCEELTHLKRPWCWKRLRAGGAGDDRGWDGWMASLIQWTCLWVNSRSWWWTGRSGMMRSMRSQRFRHDWATELNWTFTENSVFARHCSEHLIYIRWHFLHNVVV